ncbi:hypothetical protein M404DRAFT_36793 [Pisolithus tinctorius Marx 270]|uniref:Uncharacterized protein n=1 Tax=Pisolithus tinctorius Marx 270 TaxID=870435 RepID=A0A0C3J4U3_PISTI|nr:hypothetical protein M404DRAFT_36793 [Pisolithus tinctorius Marx 270]
MPYYSTHPVNDRPTSSTPQTTGSPICWDGCNIFWTGLPISFDGFKVPWMGLPMGWDTLCYINDMPAH